MPRFSTRSMLIVFGLVAIWLATFAGFSAASDVRRSMLLLILVAATCLAIGGRGKQRTFWAAFAIVMFACGGLSLSQPLHRYVPDFMWQHTIGYDFQSYYGTPTPYAPVPVYATPQAVQPAQPIVTYSAPAYPAAFPAPNALPFRYPAMWLGMTDSLVAAWILGLSALCGWLATFILWRIEPASSAELLAARRIVEQELQK